MSEVARVTGGRLDGPDVVVSGAVTDSRAAAPGQLFVPVVAERDGHDFVPGALAAGASGYLTARTPVVAGASSVVVADTTAALGALGRHAREACGFSFVVGVTGSVGKTSVKDLLAASLAARWRTSANLRSFNNELGVPLTLFNAPAGTEALVVEMGARDRGHIKALCDLALPTVGVVTRVAAVHTEVFGTIEDVAAAKSELVEALPSSGTAVLNAGDPRVAAMAARTGARVLLYRVGPAAGAAGGGTSGSGPGGAGAGGAFDSGGAGAGAGRAGGAGAGRTAGAGADGEVRAEDVVLGDDLRPSFRLVSPWGTVEVQLEARGLHMVENAVAAAAAALACDVPLAALPEALGRAALSPWRMEVVRLDSGGVLVNDAYNANPTSTAAALRALAALPARRRIAVLGVMAEIGTTSDAEHVAVGELARELGIEVVSVGVPAYGGVLVDDVPGAVDAIGEVTEGVALLVKASRVAALERIADLLA